MVGGTAQVVQRALFERLQMHKEEEKSFISHLHATGGPRVSVMKVTASNDWFEEVASGEIARKRVLAPFRCQIEIQRCAVFSDQARVVYRKSV